MALLVVIAVIVVVTLGVGIVGIARIGKDRPPLKSYELPPKRTPDELQRMRLAAHQARMRVVATDLETDSDTQSTESHVRARGGEESRDGARLPPQSLATDLIQFIAKVLVQLTGIPLLTGEAADPTTTSSTTMGNTAKPSLAVHGDLNALHNSAEIDVLRDNKPQAASTTTATTESHWSEQESSSGNSDDESSSYDAESDSDETTATVSPLDGFVLDGVQFYATVAKLSIATTHNAIDIGLFRASAIILRERRKALEDACIHAVEQQYPDIMCLPSHASARYSSPAPSSKSLRVNGDDADAVARTQVASPTARAQLETSFLKAA